ncbi:MAG: hypothetical protein H6660_16440 [Ardenticatenaceae bacterium]|nr:hypothetical protein [Ardenticatenaceae bacterium]
MNCLVGMTGQPLEILIDFQCGAGFAICNPPLGYPGTYTRQFNQNAIPIAYNAGYIYTGTGPTAVTLQGIDGTSASLPIAAGAVLVLLAGVTMFVVRRRQA